MRGRFVVGLACALVASSCGGAPSDREAAPAPSPTDGTTAEHCRSGQASPVSVDLAAKTLRQYGFDVGPERESGICSAADVIAVLTNIRFHGRYENIDDHDRVSATQGNVSCAIRRRPIYPAARTAVVRDEDTIGIPSTEFTIANVECAIYTREADPEAQISKLGGAMKLLEQAVRHGDKP